MVEQPTPQHPTTGQAQREYLDVPYTDKDATGGLGARWDQTVKRWYDPRPPTTGLDRWAARTRVPDLLPGEDRTFGAGLFTTWCRDHAGSPASAPASPHRTGNDSVG